MVCGIGWLVAQGGGWHMVVGEEIGVPTRALPTIIADSEHSDGSLVTQGLRGVGRSSGDVGDVQLHQALGVSVASLTVSIKEM